MSGVNAFLTLSTELFRALGYADPEERAHSARVWDLQGPARDLVLVPGSDLGRILLALRLLNQTEDAVEAGARWCVTWPETLRPVEAPMTRRGLVEVRCWACTPAGWTGLLLSAADAVRLGVACHTCGELPAVASGAST